MENEEVVTYSVLVGNIGWVLNDELSETTARACYEGYIAISKGAYGQGHRAYNEQVTLWASNEHDPIDEYIPEDIEIDD